MFGAGRLRHRRRPRVAVRPAGSGTPEQIQTIVKGLLVRPTTVSGLDATRPRPIKADLEKLRAPAQRGAATGDPATLTSPDLQTTERSIDQSMLRACGYQYLQITATDAAYHAGAPQRQRAVL